MNNLINRDLKDASLPASEPRIRRVHFHAAAVLGVALTLAAIFWPGPPAVATRRPPDIGVHQPEKLNLPLNLPEARPALPMAADEPPIQWQEITIKRGDTLSGIFDTLNLDPQQLSAVLAADKKTSALRRLVPGQTLHFHIEDGQLLAIKKNLSAEKALIVQREADGYEVSVADRPVETRVAHAVGVIDSSLYSAGTAAGLSDRLIMELVGVFGWDIDFALDIRKGDRFVVLYDERWMDGSKLDDGEIVAAEFVNQGRVYRAIRFTDPEGNSSYYDPQGRSMRKEFLRSPVDFRRISSRFQAERFHPILGRKRPHQGVDYAAAVGTPIKAAGDGKISFHGWKGGYGRAVVIQHGGHYSTLYGHMSRFAKGLRVGSRVRQGQVIGYVGMSGLATGPHLHYEFRVDGVHRNPLTVKLPQANPIAAQYRPGFEAMANNLISQLDVLDRARMVASGK